MDIRGIAGNAGFDVVDAIRQLAREVIALEEMWLPEEGAATTEQIELSQLLNVRLAGVLAKAGYASADAVKAASDEELLAIAGIGEKALALIREQVK